MQTASFPTHVQNVIAELRDSPPKPHMGKSLITWVIPLTSSKIQIPRESKTPECLYLWSFIKLGNGENLYWFLGNTSHQVDNSLRIGNLDFATSLQANGGCV